MLHIGLKLWSTNNNYSDDAARLYKEGLFQYIELYAVPGSFEGHISLWSDLNIPFIIHAPHYGHGLNLAKKENVQKNIELVDESRRYADALATDAIIIHSGVNGDIEETARQLLVLNDKRFLIENKPYYGNAADTICNGSSVEEIEFIIKETGFRFCLDIGHAICSANARGIDPISYMTGFMNLKPHMYHLTDGNYSSAYDLHCHLGKGDYPLKQIMKMLPPECVITIETNKNSQHNLDDFADDVRYFKNMKGDS